jgi:uncharacterized membrane protein YgcG
VIGQWLQTIDLALQVVDDSGTKKSEIDEIVLVDDVGLLNLHVVPLEVEFNLLSDGCEDVGRSVGGEVVCGGGGGGGGTDGGGGVDDGVLLRHLFFVS